MEKRVMLDGDNLVDVSFCVCIASLVTLRLAAYCFIFCGTM